MPLGGDDPDMNEPSFREQLRRALHPTGSEKADLNAALWLIRQGVPLGPYENGMVSPLTHAVSLDATEVIEAILQRGIPVDQRVHGDMTPLMVAARDGKLAALKLLIARGADVHATMNDGTTVLGLAQFNVHPDCAEVLKNTDREREEFRQAIAVAHIAQQPVAVMRPLALKRQKIQNQFVRG
ncbi:MAG: ankyrin repeat domain-containing protein [Alphaproteobacteria bacterium]